MKLTDEFKGQLLQDITKDLYEILDKIGRLSAPNIVSDNGYLLLEQVYYMIKQLEFKCKLLREDP
jgi:hypothetical protein